MRACAFILSYKDIDYLNNWIDISKYKDIDLFIVDNGPQIIPERLKPYVIHSVYKNIFCAGGWNLICKLAFNKMGYDKIIVTQDDLKFSQEHVIQSLKYVSKDTIIGGRNDMFYYSFFGIHKETYKLVGEFDESFLEVTCEDNDYHYRAKLTGIQHRSMGFELPNDNLSSKELSWKFGNQEYLIQKWGPEKSWGDFTYTVPFNGARPCHKINREEYYTHIKYEEYSLPRFPDLNGSDIEYARAL